MAAAEANMLLGGLLEEQVTSKFPHKLSYMDCFISEEQMKEVGISTCQMNTPGIGSLPTPF